MSGRAPAMFATGIRQGERPMRELLGLRRLLVATTIVALFLVPACQAQNDTGETQGIDVGNYNVQQNIELGYRQDWINGNFDSYNTFINLGTGPRLFDYTLGMRSLNHQGLVFDNLTFTNFGYGGDPNDVSRLRLDKNKWYDFSALFRRDKNFWNWNLFANPFNPVSTDPALPATPITSSPHALDLVRRMQDYDLILFPQSRIRFRLGYSRDRDEGPGFFTTDSGTVSPFPTAYSYTTNAYQIGVDVRLLPRTTLSYDQFLNYFRQNNVVTDNPTAAPGNFSYQLADGTLVDLGIVWGTDGLPCAAPVTNVLTAPPTVTPNCNGFLLYSQSGYLHNFMPTERFRFQSTYFKNFEMSGSVAYSTANSIINNFNETVIGWTMRSASPGGTAAGPADARRVTVDANWSGIYTVTDKFRILDEFRYANWHIPGIWNSILGNFFTAGGTGLGAPVGVFLTANCNAGNEYTGSTCPSHTVKSAADLTSAVNWNFLKQDLKSNTLQFEYDFTRRYTARIGYQYTHRAIVDSSTSFNTQEIYYPGGTDGTAANAFDAARGDCTPTGPPPSAGASPPLPNGCVLNADGSVTYTPPAPATAASLDLRTFNENALLLGFTAHPVDEFSIVGNVAFGYNDRSFSRISPRQLQTYRLDVNYEPKPWARLDGVVDIGENRNNVYAVNDLEHDRMYSFSTVLSPNSRLSVDFGYSYWDVYEQAAVCYSVGSGPSPAGATPCPTASSPVPLGALAVYGSTDHYAYAGLLWKVDKRVTAEVGFDGSFNRSSTTYFNQPQFESINPPALQPVTLNPYTPSGTLSFNYLRPTGSITVNVYKGLSYKAAWNYYGFDNKSVYPAGLAPIPSQNFNGNTATFSARYAF
jgi:hypothetical protein